jgi:hypothetical protein
MYSMIMASFDGAASILFGFGKMPEQAAPAESTVTVEENTEGKENKAYGYDAERPTRGTRLVKRLDGDGDGGLSWGELGESRRGRKIARNFDKIDNDGDGKLSAAELDSFRQSRGTRLVERMDGDGDGGLSWNELGETRGGRKIARNFDRIDNDGDGKLTAAELDSFQKSRHARWHHPEQAQAPEQPQKAEVQAPSVEEPAPLETPEVQEPQAPVSAPESAATQSFFFALSSSGTSAQQASSSYNVMLALFR